MSDRKIWYRLGASICALLVISAFAIAGFGPKYYPSLFTTQAFAESAAAEQSSASQPMTIGTCDTAGPIEVESTGGTTAPTAYATLKDSFDAIIAGTHTGSINIDVCGNTSETASATLTASGVGAASYTDVTIRPVGGPRVIEGSFAGGVIRLNGADNVVIDGRPGGTGTARDLTVRNNSTLAATAAIWLSSVAAGNGASNNTVRNLEIAAGVDQSGSSTNATFGIAMSGTALSTTTNGVDNDNNSFIANRIVKARYGIMTRGTTTDLNINPVITDNIIGPNAFGSDQIGKVGILMQADTGATISRNTVQFVGCLDPQACTGADRMGIAIGNESWSMTPGTITSNTYTVTKNVIHDIIEELTFSCMGLNLATTGGGTATNNLVANNFIYNVRANGTSGDQAVGLGIAGGHTDRVVFNSIAMTGDVDPGASTASSNFGSGIRLGSANGTTHLNLTLMNNSVYMDLSSTSGPTVRFYAISGPSNAYSFGTGGENYNNYYINPGNTQLQTGGLGTVSGATLTTQFATLANWQTAYTAVQDANSIQADPGYLSATGDLHLIGTSANLSVGTAIAGVTDDIDAQARPNGAGTDIGADEYYATPGSLQLSSATYGGNEGLTANITVTRTGGSAGAVGATVTLTDGTATGGAACTAGIDYINPGPQILNFADLDTSESLNVTLCTDGDTDPAETFTVTLSNPTGGATLGSPTVATTTITNVPPPFTGSYNVGTGEGYTSLTNTNGIFEGLNLAGATGNVTINITSDLVGESGSVALNQLAGGFTVTIKPTGAARTISGSSTLGILRFNDADGVTIDGSLTGATATGVGGNDAIRNLTVQNTNAAATAGAVVAFGSSANGVQNNTVKNVKILGQDPTQTLIGIHFGGAAPGGGGTDNDNNRIENCSFKKSFIGIYNSGASAANPNTGNVITMNDLSATGADRMRRAGIFFFNQNGIEVTLNSIGGIVADESADAIGIIAGIQNVTTTSVTTGGVFNANISRNRISGIASTNATGFSASGIAIAGDAAGPNTIANNMISGVIAPSTSPDFVAGVFVAGVTGSDTRLYHNSVSNTGARGAVANQIGSYGIAISGTNPKVDLKNNIFYNTQTSGGGAAAKSYAIGMTSTTFTNLTSNYNDFFTSGANAAGFRTGSLDTAGTDHADLTAWQTATSGDANSLAVDPLFVDNSTDLHLQGTSTLIGAGIAAGGITVDFDGQTRDATPDIGADEIVIAVPGSLQFSSSSYNVGEAGPTATVTVTRTGGTDGAVSVNYATGLPGLSGILATGGAACTAGVDYINASGTLNFANGDASESFNIAICDDTLFEPTEDIPVNLSMPTGGATIGMPSSALVIITDNDPQPTVQFSSATYTIGEGLADSGVNPAATITVNLSGASQGISMVDFATVAGGTATGGASCTAGVDYITTSGTLTFNPGEVSKQFNVSTCVDTEDESDETVNLALTNPAGVTLGTPNTAVLTITDNDNPAGPVTVTASAGTPTGSYMTLTAAIAAVNDGTHQGNIVISINQNTTEPASVVINSSGAGPANYTGLVIQPGGDNITVSGATVTGRGLIELNGADNVDLNGDNPATMGSNRNLTLQNTAANTVTFTSVVRIALAATVVNTATNDKIRNLNMIGNASGRNIAAATTTTGTENTTFGFIAGPGASTTDGTVAPVAIASVTSTIAAGATASSLAVDNNNITNVARGIATHAAAATVFPSLIISGNTIGNPTAGAVDQVYNHGVMSQGSANGLIARNTIYVEGFVGSSGTSATVGINVGAVSANGTYTIEGNKVLRARNNHPATFAVQGINLGGSNSHIVQNNFVADVMNNQVAGTGGFSTTFAAFGIRVGSGTGHKILHNSVHLFGAMPGIVSTNLTTALGITATGQTGLEVRNNIFSNQITGGNPAGTRNVSIFLPAAATVAMNLTQNNNAYYSGADALNRLAQVGATFGAGEYTVANFDPNATTPATNFRAYTSTLSAAGTNDNASFASTVAPPFTSNLDLHIADGTQTRLESAGAAAGVTADIDNTMRNATTPDIGADEFNGVLLPANDIEAISIITPANGTVIGRNFDPVARFANVGLATQTNVTVRFRILDGSMATVYNQTAIIPSIASLQAANVTFPSANLAAAGNYTAIATAENPGDANPTNDSVNSSFQAINPISGTVSVGTGGDFTSLTNSGGLFQAINGAGLSANSVINITTDLTAETGTFALNQWTEQGVGGYTLTIKPSGAARTISGTSAANTGLINLNSVDRLTIDGSLSGGTDRSLTITNAQLTGSSVIWLKSATGNGATNNTFKNTILNGGPGPNSTSIAGILSGSGTALGGDAEAPNSNNTIENNFIYRVQNSLFIRGGTVAANFDQNWVINNNDLGSSDANDNNVFRGMLIGNVANFAVTNNDIQGVRSTTTTGSAMSGIQVALLVSNGNVSGNRIRNIKNVSTGGTGAYGIMIGTTSTASNLTVANNFVWDVAANGSATIANNGFGISFLGSGTGHNLYHNSVNMNTNQTTVQTSAAMFVNSTMATAGAINLRNNVLSNSQTTGTRYAVYSLAAATVFTAIDYNDYFAQNVGFIGGSARATLADWQTATTQDANSKAVDPLFVSATDLHLQATSTLVNAGVAGTGITTDIDGETRDAMPDIGADELAAPAMPGSLQFSSATYNGGEGDGTFTATVTRTGGDDGTVTVQYATSNGTATGGASCTPGVDYVTTSGLLTFLDGETSKTFNVTVCNDTDVEPSETINYTLSNPTGGAVLGTPSTAVQTIVDNDLPPGIFSIGDVRVFEGNSGAVNATFTITYGGPAVPVSVQYATANGTATSGPDYIPTSGTVSFNSLQTEGGTPVPQTQTITVLVNGDVAKESNEFFFVNLTGNSGGTVISDNQGVGVIVDEDRAYVADFDRDRVADVSVFRPSEGRWYVLESATNGLSIEDFGTAGDIAVPGDYDADGIADHALWRPSTGQWYRKLSSNATKTITTWGTTGDKPVQGDYDGDGKTDMAVYRPSTGRWWILRSSDGASSTVAFGLSTDRLVQGDYDGDAKTDIAVYRDGQWFILRSSDGQVQVGNWGTASDKPVSGDFDGDGRNDLAIYRNGNWWVLNSLEGTTSVIAWGVSDDIPVPADYDADGKTDHAIFRPSVGDWYMLRSTAGALGGLHWGVSGDVPVPAAYLPQ